MAVQATQLFNVTLSQLLRAFPNMYAILVGDHITISDTDLTLADIGGGGTPAQVAADSQAYIAPGNDGAPIALAGGAFAENAGVTEFRWNDLDWGAGLNIDAFGKVVVMEGTAAAPAPTDPVRFHMDADDSAGDITIVNGALNITAPAGNNWLQGNAQA